MALRLCGGLLGPLDVLGKRRDCVRIKQSIKPRARPHRAHAISPGTRIQRCSLLYLPYSYPVEHRTAWQIHTPHIPFGPQCTSRSAPVRADDRGVGGSPACNVHKPSRQAGRHQLLQIGVLLTFSSAWFGFKRGSTSRAETHASYPRQAAKWSGVRPCVRQRWGRERGRSGYDSSRRWSDNWTGAA